MVPVNCNTVERETADSIEKDKKTKQDKPVRDITLTKKCDLKMKRVREKQLGEDNFNADDKMVTVSIAQLNNLMNMFDKDGNRIKDDNAKTKVRLSSLGILLASPDLHSPEQNDQIDLSEIVNKLVLFSLKEAGNRKIPNLKEDISKEISRLVSTCIEEAQKEKSLVDKRKQKREYNKKLKKKREKEKAMDPLLSVKKDLASLANGIMETDTEEEDLDEKKEKKKQCKKGNARHYPADHPKAGEFAPAGTKDGSWSMYFTDGSDCKKGRAKLKGGSEQFTKATNCGRKTKDGDKKNQYKCSKPKEKYS